MQLYVCETYKLLELIQPSCVDIYCTVNFNFSVNFSTSNFKWIKFSTNK